MHYHFITYTLIVSRDNIARSIRLPYQPRGLLGRVTNRLLFDGERRVLVCKTKDVAEVGGMSAVVAGPVISPHLMR